MKYKTVKGFNDIYNTEYKVGKYIKDIIIEISESYNYKPLELALFEYSDLFLDYYGEEITEQLYTIDNRYNLDISLRYDGVISILRSIIENKLYVDKSLPIKMMSNTVSYKFNKRNRKQKATREEFIFVNANNSNYHLDIENINIALDVLYTLGMEEIVVMIYQNTLKRTEFSKIKAYLDASKINYRVAKNKEDSFYDKLEYEFYYNDVLLASGGRHDHLAKKLTAPSIPSSSLKFDIDEIKNIIEFTSLIPPMEEELDFLIISCDNNYDESLMVASRLRELGVKVDISYIEYDPSRLRDFIDRMNIPYTIMTNKHDVDRGIVTVRNSISKEEGNVYFEEFLEELIEHSKHNHED